jgi:hypothetical protein
VSLTADRFRFDPFDPTSPATLQTDDADSAYWTWSAGLHAQFVHGVAVFVNYRGNIGLKSLDIAEVAAGVRFERSF